MNIIDVDAAGSAAAILASVWIAKRLFFKERTNVFPRLPLLSSMERPVPKYLLSKGMIPTLLIIQFCIVFNTDARIRRAGGACMGLWTALLFANDVHTICPQIVHFTVASISAAFHRPAHLRLFTVCLYAWGGLQKMNRNFCTQGWVRFFSPLFERYLGKSLVNRHLETLEGTPATVVGILAALTECILGLGLLFRDVDRVAALILCGMHALILFALGPYGANAYKVIWPWNALCIFLLVRMFAQERKDDVSNGTYDDVLTIYYAGGSEATILCVEVVLFVVAPAFSWIELWHPNLSFQMHSSNFPYCQMDLVTFREGVSKDASDRSALKRVVKREAIPIYKIARDFDVQPVLSESAFLKWARAIASAHDQMVEASFHGRPSVLTGNRSVRTTIVHPSSK